MNRPSATELRVGKGEFLLLQQALAEKQKLLDSSLEKLSTEFETNTCLKNKLINSKKELHDKEEELLFMKRHLLKYEEMIIHADEDLAKTHSELELVRASLSSAIAECEAWKICCKGSEDAVFKLELYISKTELLLEEVRILFCYMI